MSVTETLTLEQPVQTRTIHRFLLPRAELDDDRDEGLVMLLDSKKEQRTRIQSHNFGNPILRTPVPQLCGQRRPSSLILSNYSPLLQTTQNYYVKSFNSINALLIDKVTEKIVPFLLYTSLIFLAIQAMTVLILLLSSKQTIGLWFIFGCMSILGYLFCFTSQTKISQIQTPPPTPSHSSASLYSSS